MAFCRSALRRAGAALLLSLLAAGSGAESRFAPTGQGASAGLDFRIVIPEVMRLLENTHPARLDVDAQGRLAGTQTLVVLSNLKRGFCLTLRQAAAEGTAAMAWQVRALQSEGLSLEATPGGWRLCAERPGRYRWQLQHEFEPVAGRAPPAPSGWPVWAELAAL